MKGLGLALLLYCPLIQVLGIERADLVGEWQLIHEDTIDHGVIGKVNERWVLFDDGGYYCEGSMFLSLVENDLRILTSSGPDKGIWNYDGKKLSITVEEYKIDYFSSAIPEFGLKDFKALVEQDLEEPLEYVFDQRDGEDLLFREVEEGSLMRMRPISDEIDAGVIFMEPIGTFSIEELGGDPTVLESDSPDLVGDRFRSTSSSILSADDFSFADWLPTFGERAGIGHELRSEEEILSRLLCNYVVVSWVSMDDETFPTDGLKGLVEYYSLEESMTEAEKEIMGVDRDVAQIQFGDTICWKMENMWALAWVLGFDEATDVDQGQIGEEVFFSLWEFIAPAWKGREALNERIELRSLNEVAQMEDLFYCAHNAVRSAQLGNADSVPEGFHPVADGGVIHEKRHSLTWVLSPGVDWEETDLST
ncbi:MAG: DUF4272 domain-containing protein [Verrucomicrobiota bacterium]